MISIILVSYNVGDVTKACIQSIKRNVTIPYEIIVVDNNSEKATIDILDGIDGINLIKSGVNQGFPRGCNMGLAAAKGDIIWFLNNDTIVPPNSLERMTELLLSSEDIGIVGPVTNRINGIQQIPVDYTDEAEIDGFAERIATDYSGQTQRVIRLVGFSMLMRKASLDRLGGFDERMGIGTFEDDDLSLRFVSAGYKLLVARDAFIHHVGNASFKAAGGYPPGGIRNQYTASCSAGMTVPDETVINKHLATYVDENAQRILHAECGAGAYGLFADEAGKYIEALESNAAKANIAKNHYKKISMYTPGVDFQFNGRDFDTAIIEKQYDMELSLSLVRSIRPALCNGARLVLQTPKITAVNGRVHETYMENWDANGYIPLHGQFDILSFIQEMCSMGFILQKFQIADVRRDFFNRNSFARYMESAAQNNSPAEFFKEAVYVFEYCAETCGLKYSAKSE